MSDPKPFDPSNPAEVKALQQKLNEFAQLSAAKDTKPFQLEVTGTLDKPTLAQWKKFKQQHFADSTLTASYLKESLGITAPEGMNPKAPPTDVIKQMQEKLGLKATGKLDDDTATAITRDKAENWIDDRINAGALKKLDAEIASRKAAQGISASTMIMGALATAGAGAVAYTAYTAGQKNTPTR